MSSKRAACPKCQAHAVVQRRRRNGTALDCQVCDTVTFVERAAVAVAEKPKPPLPDADTLYWSGLN